jgi:predicted NUDIX family NTP pyrophosphohydrolase
MTARKLTSAGLLMFERTPSSDGQRVRVLLAHPGGPFYARKDEGARSIPKGEVEPDEDARDCALREFTEETGLRVEAPHLLELGEVRQRGGKKVLAWAFEGVWNGEAPRSNTFEIEWPPRSGRKQVFPEIDRLELFELEQARIKLNPAQVAFLDRLADLLAADATPPDHVGGDVV